MKTYFISRFNIFDYNFKGFQLTLRNDQAAYADLFFNEDRLEFKTNIFKYYYYKVTIIQY